MKNKTEGEMILARRRSIARMKHQGIVPKHQVLDNEISAAKRKEIWATHMIFQLMPPDLIVKDLVFWDNSLVFHSGY